MSLELSPLQWSCSPAVHVHCNLHAVQDRMQSTHKMIAKGSYPFQHPFLLQAKLLNQQPVKVHAPPMRHRLVRMILTMCSLFFSFFLLFIYLFLFLFFLHNSEKIRWLIGKVQWKKKNGSFWLSCVTSLLVRVCSHVRTWISYINNRKS